MHAVAGLGVLFFLPSCLWVAAFCRRRVSPLHFFAACLGVNLGLWIAGTTAIKAFGLQSIGMPVVFAALAATVPPLYRLFRLRWRPRVSVRWPEDALVLLGGAAAIVAYVLAVSRPFLATEKQYWSLDMERRMREADYHTVDAKALGIEVRRGPNWEPLSRWQFMIRQTPARFNIVNRSHRAVEYDLKLLIDANVDGEIGLRSEGGYLFRHYAYPPYSMADHPRNYPPPKFFMQKRIVLRPGANPFRLTVPRRPGRGLEAYVIVTDLSNTSRREFKRVFRHLYLVDNIGDSQETVSLARHLLSKPYLYVSSYDGTIFDGGGYMSADLPSLFYLYSFALAALGDSWRSLHVLYLALLVLLYWLQVRLAARGTAMRGYGVHVWALFATLAYATLMRFMRESVYVNTAQTVFLLMAIYFFRVRRERLFATYALFVALSKAGLPFLCIVLLAEAVFGQRQGNAYWMRTIGRAGAAMATAAAGIFVVGLVSGSVHAWVKEWSSDDIMGRFALLIQSVHLDFEAWRILAEALFWQTERVLAASCLLPVLWLVCSRRSDAALWCAGAAIHLLIGLSDPPYTRFHPIVQHLAYFAPASVLMAIAGARAVCARFRPGPAAALALVIGLPSVFWCWNIVARHERYEATLSTALEEDYARSVGDFLLRRARASAERGEWHTAERDARRVAGLNYFKASTLRIDAQRACAWRLVARACARLGIPREADHARRQADELERRAADRLLALAAAHITQHNVRGAIRIVRQGLEMLPGNARLTAFMNRLNKSKAHGDPPP